jgi:hypothetical protein
MPMITSGTIMILGRCGNWELAMRNEVVKPKYCVLDIVRTLQMQVEQL